MFKYLIAVVFALTSACVDGDAGTGTRRQGEIECSPENGCSDGGGGGASTGMCGDACSSAADCGGSALCRLCAGMPGSGRGTCLSGNPLTGELPAGMVAIDAGALSAR